MLGHSLCYILIPLPQTSPNLTIPVNESMSLSTPAPQGLFTALDVKNQASLVLRWSCVAHGSLEFNL